MQWHWHAWTSTVLKYALTGLQAGALAAPVEVVMTSATDDPLIHLRRTGLERYAIKILESDESKWQGPEICQ